MLVGDTGFEPVTSSVSAISDTPDNAAAGVSFLVWCSATALLMSHGKVKLFGIGVMALAVSAEIYSYACGISFRTRWSITMRSNATTSPSRAPPPLGFRETPSRGA
jgi:hypothetical protein